MSDQATSRETKRTRLKSDTSQCPSLDTSKLPSELKVLGVPFRVEVTKVDEGVAGETLGLYRRIQIDQDLDIRRCWTTLLHEWVHAVLYANGVANVLPDEVEEIIAQTFEHALEEMLLQIGPQVMAHLREDK
jgi:hypothetical protein